MPHLNALVVAYLKAIAAYFGLLAAAWLFFRVIGVPVQNTSLLGGIGLVGWVNYFTPTKEGA